MRVDELFKVMACNCKLWACIIRVATVREKVLENEKISRSEKSQGITFSVREIFKKNLKSHGKVREFQNFPKKMLINRVLGILVSIICKQY